MDALPGTEEPLPGPAGSKDGSLSREARDPSTLVDNLREKAGAVFPKKETPPRSLKGPTAMATPVTLIPLQTIFL